MVLVLSGPPKAGKSRLRGDIQGLLRKQPQRRWFIQVASPDGEGAWVNDLVEAGRGEEAQALARRNKEAVKAAGEFFSPAFTNRMRFMIEGLVRSGMTNPLVVDLGGIPSPQNREILSPVLGREDLVPVVLLREGYDGGWGSFWLALGHRPEVVNYEAGLAARLLGLEG